MNIKRKSTLELFEKELRFKQYSENTIKIYLHYANIFLSAFDKDIYHISQSEARSYLVDINYTSTSKQNQIISSVKLLYKYIVKCKLNILKLERPIRNKKLPIVLTQEEMQKMFNNCNNIKHKVIISLLYGCGLRVSELLNLKWTHIDRSAMILNILNGKGKKDRQVDLPENIIPLLENYYRKYKCKPYILSGQFKNTYSAPSVLSVVKQTAKKAGINKRVYSHLLRHNCFTHMAENGVDLGFIQRSAGHQNPITTTKYIHMSHNLVKNAKSPLNNINI